MNVPDISDLLYLIFTGMYTFKASSKELQKAEIAQLNGNMNIREIQI